MHISNLNAVSKNTSSAPALVQQQPVAGNIAKELDKIQSVPHSSKSLNASTSSAALTKTLSTSNCAEKLLSIDNQTNLNDLN